MLMKDAGILDVELQRAMPKPTICESEAFSKVNILDVAPAMILLAIGMGLSLLVLVLEYFWCWRKKNLNVKNCISVIQSSHNASPKLKLPVMFADDSNIFNPTLPKSKGYLLSTPSVK
jgi:hypothetical protein